MTCKKEPSRARILRAEVRRLRALLEQEQERNRQLQASTSWKITAPLRRLVSLLRGVPSAAAAAAPAIQPPVAIPHPLRLVSDGTPDPHLSLRWIDAEDAMRPLLQGTKSVDFDATTRARVAAVTSSELLSELAWDADVQALDEQDWLQQLQPGCFDYLLIEPLWNVDASQWRNAMVAESGQHHRMLEVAAHCRRFGLPVVCWFREDMDNYHRFAWLAGLADRTYALDDEMRERLAADFPARPIGLLPLAVQPRLHNPLRSGALQASAAAFEKNVLLDGWWELNDGAVASSVAVFGDQLRVCESEWDFSRARLADSVDLAKVTLGCVNALDKAALSKIFPVEIFLRPSLRLPWRRSLSMLRSAAAGCIPLILDTGEPGVACWPAFAAGQPADLHATVQRLLDEPLRRAALAHRVAADIVQQHALAERLHVISSDLGLKRGLKAELPRVAAVLVTMRPHLVAGCIERFRSEAYGNKELQIVVHGDADVAAVRALVRPGEPIHVHQLGRERSLGACLNYAVQQSSAPYWAKFDDDDLYGPRYLQEMMYARRWVDYGLAGKPPAFTYLEAEAALYWESAWSSMDNVLHSAAEAPRVGIAGATLAGRRELVEQNPLSERRRGGSDSDFILRTLASGHDVVALDSFGFARFRSADADFHTHRFDHAELLARAVRVSGTEGMGDILDP